MDIHTLIVNEISMVSCETLRFVHQQLTKIKGTDDTKVCIFWWIKYNSSR